MKRIIALTFAILLVVSMAALCLTPQASAAGGDYLGNIPYGYATVDGEMDRSYAAAVEIVAEHSNAESNYATGKFYILYDENYLYVFADIKDPTPTYDIAQENVVTDTEGITFFLDMINDGTGYYGNPSGWSEHPYDQGRIRCNFSGSSGSDFRKVEESVNGAAGITQSSGHWIAPDKGYFNIDMVGLETNDGYNIELRIEFSDNMKNKIRNGENPEIRMGVQINDNTGGAAGYTSGKDATTWSVDRDLDYEWNGGGIAGEGGSKRFDCMTLLGSEAVAYKAYYADSSNFKVDGLRNEAIYASSGPIYVNKNDDDDNDLAEGAVITDGRQATGVVYSAFDGDYLYLFAEVTDKTPVPLNTPGLDNNLENVHWDKEGIDFFLDFLWEDGSAYKEGQVNNWVAHEQGRIRCNFVGDAVGTQYHAYHANQIPDTGASGGYEQESSNMLQVQRGDFDAVMHSIKTATGYNVELRVKLGKTLKGRLANGSNPKIGIGAQINDLDVSVSGTYAGDCRTHRTNDRLATAWEYNNLGGSGTFAPMKLYDSGLAPPVVTDNSKNYTASYGTGITVDGTMDSAYGNPVYVNKEPDGTVVQGNGIAHAEVKTAFDTENIYFFATVTDYNLAKDIAAANISKHKEGMVFFLDFLYPDKSNAYATSPNGAMAHEQGRIIVNFAGNSAGNAYYTAEGTDNAYTATANGAATTGAYLECDKGTFSAKMYAKQTDTGYVIELAVQLSDTFKEKLKTNSNLQIRLGYQLDDHDPNVGIDYTAPEYYARTTSLYDDPELTKEYEAGTPSGAGTFQVTDLTGVPYHTLTLDPNGGTVGTSSITVINKAKIGFITSLDAIIPSRPGYTFLGWTDSGTTAGVTYADDAVYNAGGNSTVKAVWQANPYSISYTLNGGTHGATHPTAYNAASGAINISDPTRTGYTFTGWTETLSTSAWYNGFVDMDGNVLQPGSGTWGSAVHSEMLLLKAGVTYTFNWSGSADHRVRLYDANGGFVKNLEVQNNTYTPDSNCYVRLMYQTADETAQNNTTITASVAAKAISLPTGTTGNRSYAANWTPITCTVTLDKDSGTGGADKLYVVYGEKFYTNTSTKEAVTVITPPTRTGYTFLGYYSTDSDTQIIDANGNIKIPNTNYQSDTDITVKAKWQANTYAVTLNPNGGNVSMPSIVATYGQALSNLPTPTRTGHTFDGWFDGSGNPYTAASVYTLETDLALTARWTVNDYTLAFDTAGGITDADPTREVTFGASIGQLPEPIRYGYIFSGWFDGNNEVSHNALYTWDTDRTLTAHWTPEDTTAEHGDILLPTLVAVASLSALALAAVILFGLNKRRKN